MKKLKKKEIIKIICITCPLGFLVAWGAAHFILHLF
jgi:hypothetical protein